jgi:hypothetical protein
MSDSIGIIKKITELAPYLQEKDIDEWIIPGLTSFYGPKIAVLAVKAYGQSAQGITVAHLAFKERAKAELRSAVNTFIFKSEHWKTGRDINTYLLTVLNRLADRIAWDSDSVKKTNMPICPACRHFGQREFLVTEGKLWKCQACTRELDRLPAEISTIKNKISQSKVENDILIAFEGRLRLHTAFALHSRKGYKCPDCTRFIPESINTAFGVSCPFEDCFYSGKIEKMELMAHPVGLTQRQMMSLQSPIASDKNDSTSKSEIQDNFVAPNVSADIHLELRESFENELKILTQVLDEQTKAIKRTCSPGTIMQKLLMYEAYERMLKDYPAEMVSYLVHRKQSSDFPIQSRIFQEYIKLMEDALPYDIVRGNDVYSVCSLTDPNIQLFSGVSEFEATIKSDFSIPNNTVETYTGGVKFKNYGPCFIGLLIDVIDRNTGKSILEHVMNYSFVKINMKHNVEIGTPVFVKHFRIPSHYEMGSMVYLQRARQRIVDSVYYRLYGKHRGEDIENKNI